MTSHFKALETLFDSSVTALAPDLGIIRVSGQDAIKLLQGQTTSDFSTLSDTNGLYGALCNVKGRIIANFFALLQDESVLLVLDKALIEKVITHLKKYAVFFKTNIEDGSSDFHIYEHFGPTQSNEPDNHEFSLALKDDCLQILTAKSPVEAKFMLCSAGNELPVENPHLAPLLRLSYARPLVTLEQSENVLPQWINMQSSGGISFTKGCYTGQEIVARMQYRGKSKKQLALVLLENELVEGAKLLDQHAKEAIQVLNIASSENFSLAQVILNSSPEETGPITLDGQEVRYIPLPYAID
ncbi:CAF17-like 4Fe-4S cluster assembly/insertion protein YgfZ [Marinomonas epiphytica]